MSKKTLFLCYIATVSIITIISATSIAIAFNIKDGNIFDAIRPRLWTWGSALSGFIEKPLLGWGPENFSYAFDKYYNPNHSLVEPWFDRAHNAFLEYLTGGGVLLLLAYLLIFFIFYRHLFRIRERSDYWFWPVLFGMPIIYLVNGITMFEVLPIYICLFLFLGFFTNYSSNFQSIPININDNKIKEPLRWVVTFLLVLVTASSIYFTIYLPYKKNKLTIKALLIAQKTPQEVYEQYKESLSFYSPIGQSELDQQLFTFTDNLFAYFQEKKIINKERKSDVENITQFNMSWFERDEKGYVGIKNAYIFINVLIEAYKITGNKKFLEKSKELVNKNLTLAPTRVELLKQKIEIADLEGDKKTVDKVKNEIKKLLPNFPI